jgi:hypothetical protein
MMTMDGENLIRIKNDLKALREARTWETVGIVQQTRTVKALQDAERALAQDIIKLRDDEAGEFAKLINGANGAYVDLGAFIQAMNPYGDEPVHFPDLTFDDTRDRNDLYKLWRDRRIEVAGWLQQYHASNPKESSDTEMTLAGRRECFYWDFRFPDVVDSRDLEETLFKDGADPTHKQVIGYTDEGIEPRGGQMLNLQIVKAMRIPFVYRQKGAGRNGRVLVGHIVIGYEGAGGA